jgi:Protein of unknown function (DUF3102)
MFRGCQVMTSDRADKSDLGDETPRARDPGQLAVAAKERERVLAENAEEIRKLGKRVGRDVIEIGRRLTGMKKLCGHGNWLPWLEREFGWTDRHALNYTRVYELSLKSENFSDLEIPVSALYLLAAPSTPPEAVDEVIECARHLTGLSQKWCTLLVLTTPNFLTTRLRWVHFRSSFGCTPARGLALSFCSNAHHHGSLPQQLGVV